MVDRLVESSLKSLAYFLKNNVDGVSECWVGNPDFDYDKMPDSSNPNRMVSRPLPFMVVSPISDESVPFSMGNILYEQNISVDIGVYDTDSTNLWIHTGSMKQALKEAVHPTTGEIGIQLLNIASGVVYPDAGCLQVELEGTEYFGGNASEDVSGNRRYSSHTIINLTAFKDKEATLLENKGNIGIDDNGI